MSKEPLNYLTLENGVHIIECTSQVSNGPSKNVLLPERKVHYFLLYHFDFE